MAPTVRSIGSATAIGSGTALAVPVPAGVEEDDLVLVFLYWESTSVTASPPSGQGFAVAPDDGLTAGGDFRLSVYWKRSGGSEPSPSYAFTLSGSAFRRGQAIAVQDADTSSDPWDDTAGDAGSGANTPSLSITTTGDDRLAFWVGGQYNTGSWGTIPTGFTKRTPPSGSLEMCTATRSVASATSLSGLVGSSGGGGSNATAAWVGALKPIGSVAVGPEPGRMLIAVS